LAGFNTIYYDSLIGSGFLLGPSCMLMLTIVYRRLWCCIVVVFCIIIIHYYYCCIVLHVVNTDLHF